MASQTQPPDLLPFTSPSNNSTQTIHLAHTAKCKLHIAANQPDRNLRFLLGHAFTLDKLRLRIAEIELEDSSSSSSSSGSEDEDLEVEKAGNKSEGERERGVKFRGSGGGKKVERKRSPPPPTPVVVVDDEDDEDDREDEEVDDDLSLRRFESGAAKPPRMVGGSKGKEEGEEKVRRMLQPSEEDLRAITDGKGNEEWKGMYNKVAGCPCHGQKAPGVDKVWEIPKDGGALGKEGRRLAVVQVAA